MRQVGALVCATVAMAAGWLGIRSGDTPKPGVTTAGVSQVASVQGQEQKPLAYEGGSQGRSKESSLFLSRKGASKSDGVVKYLVAVAAKDVKPGAKYFRPGDQGLLVEVTADTEPCNPQPCYYTLENECNPPPCRYEVVIREASAIKGEDLCPPSCAFQAPDACPPNCASELPPCNPDPCRYIYEVRETGN